MLSPQPVLERYLYPHTFTQLMYTEGHAHTYTRTYTQSILTLGLGESARHVNSSNTQ